LDLQTKVQVQNYLKLFYSKRWFILITVALGIGLAILYLSLTKNEFKSTSTILIEKNTNGSSPIDFMATQGFQTTLDNHIEHLRSYKISKLALNKIEEDQSNYPFKFEIFNIGDNKAFETIESKVSWLRSRLEVGVLNRKADIITITFKAHHPDEAAALSNIFQQVYIDENLGYVESELTTLKNYLIEKIYEKEKQLLDAEDRLNNFKQKENINLLSEQTKEQIARVTNIQSKKEQYQIELQAALEAKKTIEQQIRRNKDFLKNSNVQINTNFAEKLSEEIANKKATKLKMEAQLENSGFSRATFSDRLKQVDREITSLEEQLQEQMKLKSQESSAESAIELFNELQKKYLNIDIEIKSKQKSIEQIDEYLSSVKLEESNLPDKELQLIRYQRQVDIYRKIYLMLTEKLEETEIRISSKRNNAKIIDKALVDVKPVHPRKSLLFVGSFIGSFVLSIGILFLIEYLDNTVKTEDEIDRYGIARLGLIPKIGIDGISNKLKENGSKFKGEIGTQIESRLVSHIDPKSMVAESYRSLRTNLTFHLKKTEKSNSFLITSCGPQEGKSTTISNIAISFSQQGKRVVIVDADLRKPVLHSVFALNKENGLSDVLVGEKKVSDVIKSTLIDNLYLITSGTIPPNPAEMLSHEELDNLIAYLKKNFDVVLFDTPPVIAVTDAAIIAEKVDFSILVIRANVTDRDMISEAVKRVGLHNQNLIGTVMNDFDFERHYGYKYQYYNYYQKS
jgi:capsular exopolysaccharide synthesis family protein